MRIKHGHAAGSWLLMLAQLEALLLLPCTAQLHSRYSTVLAAAQASRCPLELCRQPWTWLTCHNRCS
jgi:hypothetical protein